MKYPCTDWRSQRLLSEIRWEETGCSQAQEMDESATAWAHWHLGETHSHRISPTGVCMRNHNKSSGRAAQKMSTAGLGGSDRQRALESMPGMVLGQRDSHAVPPHPAGSFGCPLSWKAHECLTHQIYAALDRSLNPLWLLPWNAKTVTVTHFKIRNSFKPKWSYQ